MMVHVYCISSIANRVFLLLSKQVRTHVHTHMHTVHVYVYVHVHDCCTNQFIKQILFPWTSSANNCTQLLTCMCMHIACSHTLDTSTGSANTNTTANSANNLTSTLDLIRLNKLIIWTQLQLDQQIGSTNTYIVSTDCTVHVLVYTVVHSTVQTVYACAKCPFWGTSVVFYTASIIIIIRQSETRPGFANSISKCYLFC